MEPFASLYNEIKHLVLKLNGFKPFEQANTNKVAIPYIAYNGTIATAGIVLPANPNRKLAAFCNTSDKDIYLMLGNGNGAVAANNCTVVLKAQTSTNISYYEVPINWVADIYALIAVGASSGGLTITELT